MTRDDVALVVLSVLLNRSDPAVARPSSRVTIIREALAWGDEFMLQRAVLDDRPDPAIEVSADTPQACIGGYSSHRWREGACNRCGVNQVTFQRLRSNFKGRQWRNNRQPTSEQ